MRLLPGEKVRIGVAVAGAAGLIATAGCLIFGIPWWVAAIGTVVAFLITGYLAE
jgi:4-hydroxybenzoate polyprenyltransferase